MSKVAINNEIVLMRHAVRQSRVRVVRKLVSEVKLLRARKHGDAKVLEKCKRKADRLVAEITAIKKVKDDDISRFGITEKRSLKEILTDTSSEPNTRVMARLANYKILADRINKFKEKFPVHEEHLGPGRKKLSKMQKKTNKDMKNQLKLNQSANNDEDKDNKMECEKLISTVEESSLDSENDLDSDNKSNHSTVEEEIDEEKEESKPAEDKSEPGSILRIKPKPASKRKAESDVKKCPNKSSKQEKLEKPKSTNNVVESKKPTLIKVVSKEATVKRFSDLIAEKESAESIAEPISITNSVKNETKIEKQVDPFFMTENGESEYMSVVVPKLKLCEDEEDDKFLSPKAQRQKNFHERKNKFFSKIDERSSRHDGDKYGSKIERRGKNYLSGGKGPIDKVPRVGKDRMKNGNNVKSDLPKKSQVNEEELHPSWVARKKQQEILKQGFQGKKIVFED